MGSVTIGTRCLPTGATHSFTSLFNLSRFCLFILSRFGLFNLSHFVTAATLETQHDVSHKECSGVAEKWRSERPCLATVTVECVRRCVASIRVRTQGRSLLHFSDSTSDRFFHFISTRTPRDIPRNVLTLSRNVDE